MIFYNYTNKGPRRENEDSLYVKKYDDTIYACIADGVGGIAHGAIASNYATDKFARNVEVGSKLTFKDLLIETNEELESIATKDYNVEFIATTFSGLYANRNEIRGIHIGDSRIILIREKKIIQLTIDHSEVGRLIRENKLSKELSNKYYRKNILENVLGNTSFFNYQEFEMKTKRNDRLILSTDGFHESVSEEVILRISNKYSSISEVFRSLVIELENRILRDNASFICIQL